MGSLLIAVGQEMLSSGGSIEALEARMANFSQQIEQQVSAGEQKMIHQAASLCQSVVEIDKLEAKLSAEIKAMADIEVLAISWHKKNKT